MAFKLFKKYCFHCGEEVQKEKAVKRFGGYFCSEEHVEAHKRRIDEQQAKKAKGGGCCCCG